MAGRQGEREEESRCERGGGGVRCTHEAPGGRGGPGEGHTFPDSTGMPGRGRRRPHPWRATGAAWRGGAGELPHQCCTEATGNRKASATSPGVALGGARGRGVASGPAMWRGGRGLPLTTWPKPVSHIAPRGGSARCHRSARPGDRVLQVSDVSARLHLWPQLRHVLTGSFEARVQAHAIRCFCYAINH